MRLSRRQALRQLLGGAGAAAMATTSAGLLVPKETRRRIWQVGEKLIRDFGEREKLIRDFGERDAFKTINFGSPCERTWETKFTQTEGRTKRFPMYANGNLAGYTEDPRDMREGRVDYQPYEPPEPSPETRKMFEEFMRNSTFEDHDLEHFVHDEYVVKSKIVVDEAQRLLSSQQTVLEALQRVKKHGFKIDWAYLGRCPACRLPYDRCLCLDSYDVG